MPDRSVVRLEREQQHERTFAELSSRARGLQQSSRTGSLQSLRTVLMALFLSADEALDHLPDVPGPGAPAAPALAQSLGAAGAYLLYACELSNLQLGELISEYLERDEGELPEATRSVR